MQLLGSIMGTIMFAGGVPALIQSTIKTAKANDLKVCPIPE